MSNAPQEIIDLVVAFARNRQAYMAANYNEAQVRSEFIDPFLAALGWDVYNKRGYAPQYREVLTEAALGGSEGARTPDYTLRVGTDAVLFVEAKKPLVDIQANVDASFQLRRYAWSKGLKTSILTDFQEFAVYDCQVRPLQGAKASEGRVLYFTYDQYPEHWQEIAAVFSRDAVWQGDYNRWAEANTGKHGTQTVDAAFLKDMNEWREKLARNLALRNPTLSDSALNYAVQMTLDRIVFWRICEDRGIEPFEQLLQAANGKAIYLRLLELFRLADQRYNSGLFHFSAEKEREAADTLTPRLQLDDQVLKEIIGKLYWPAPYDFNQMPVEILGRVYEQFLGSVIRLTAGHQAKIDLKPEVRKAGGVYYTPQYIVRYIVEHTVGELLKDKSPADVADLAICDPACGSGSFLLGAYEYLLAWYRDWYAAHPTRQPRKEIYQGKGGAWYLTVDEKKQILTRHLYGVDIDQQAVEVTKLSLLLKVLEGENQGSLKQLSFLGERVLPDMARNIRCGNSLIGWDYPGTASLSSDELRRINPFDWQQAFPLVFARGGFDAVIGNPPYVRATRFMNEKDYYLKHYTTAYGAYDEYVLFMELGLRIVTKEGLVGVITPNKYLVADYAKKLRHILLTSSGLIKLVDLGKCKSVFAGAFISTAISIYNRSSSNGFISVIILNDVNVEQISKLPENIVSTNILIGNNETIQIYLDIDSSEIINKLNNNSKPLCKVASVRTGVMGFNYWDMDKWISDSNTGVRIVTNSYMDRYSFLWGKKVRLYKKEYYEPRLDPACSILSPETIALFNTEKIIIRGVARRLSAMLDDEGMGLLVAVHSATSLVYDHKYILGLINSTLFNWVHLTQFYSAKIPEGSLRYPVSFLSQLPIRTIDFSSPADVARHDQMVQLVERMLQLHKDLAAAATPHARELLERQITATDAAIDRLVYELYELTPEEIALVEAGG